MFHKLKIRRTYRIIAILAIALMISIGVQYWLTSSDLNRVRDQFESQSTEIFDQISRKFKETEAFMNSLIAFRKTVKNLKQYPDSNYIYELLKLFPHIRQVSIVQVNNMLLPGSSGTSAYKLKFISQLINNNTTLQYQAINKHLANKKIQSLLFTKKTISGPFKYKGKTSYLIVKPILRPNDVRSGGRHYVALFVDVENLLNPILKRLKTDESLSIEVDGEVLYKQIARRSHNNSTIVPHFSYRTQMESYSKTFSMIYRRNLANTIAPGNRFLLVFTIVLAITAVLIVLWTLIVNSKKFRKKAQDALRKNRETAVTTMDSIEEAVIIVDYKGNIEHLNSIAEKLISLKLKQAKQKHISNVFDLRDIDHKPILDKLLYYCLEKLQGISIPVHANLWKKHKGIPIAGSLTPLLNSKGKNDGAVIVFRDLVDSIKMNEKLSYYASHDDTTNLLNRREFINRLQYALDKSKEFGLVSVLIYMDLDQFKIVNDSCGHLVGDELLEKIARLLEGNIRVTDTLARLGGDEFAILLEDCNIDEAKEIASKMNEAINHYHFKWQKKVFDIAASLGIVEISSSRYSVSELLSLADSACYLAKQDGRNRYHVYSANDDAMIKHRREIQWVQRIRQAYEDNRFRLFLQEIRPLSPKLKVNHRHFEILLRMLGEDDKVILPMSYILAAERYDKMAELDAWVINNAFTLILEYIEIDRNASFAINLSGQSLGNSDITRLIIDLLKKTPSLCKHIIFEITETAAITNPSQAGKFVSTLRRIGVRFALDDFGTGLSSFAYLKNLKVDFIKIDGQFIRDISKDKINYALVEAINKIGHVMGIKTIAEYVENEAIKETLQKIGVDYGQGLWFSRPIPMETIIADLSIKKEKQQM